MKAPFRFVIADSTIANYYSVSAGAVAISPILTFLKPTIVDWSTLSLNYKRDSVMLGVIRSYSPEVVRFVKDAAQILRFIKNSLGGVEAIAYLGMYLLNTTTQQYDFLDYWQFDFSKTNNQLNYYEIALMEGGLSSLLKAYGNVPYATPLNDPALPGPYPIYNPVLPDLLPVTDPIPPGILPPPPVPQLVFCDGIPILGEFQFISDQTVTPGPTYSGEVIQVATDWGVHGDIYTIGMSDFSDLGDYGGSVGTTNLPEPGKVPQADPLNVTKCFQCQPFAVPFKMRIAWNLNFNWETFFGGSGHVNLQLRYIITDGTASHGGAGNIVTTGILQQDPVGLGATGTSAQFKWNGISDYLAMNANYCLFVGFSFTTSGGSLTGFANPIVNIAPLSAPPTQPVACIKLKYSFVPQNSVVRAISQWQLFDYLRALMATNGGTLPNAYASRSNLLTISRNPIAPGNGDTDPTRTFITCGDALRGLKTVTIVDPYFPTAPTVINGVLINPGDPVDIFQVPAINTTMNDFAKDLLVNLNAGVGIEKNGFGTDTLVAETLDYFFDDDDIDFLADLGDNISDFEMKDFNDYRGSGLSIGEPDQQFDSINGPLETMSEVEWATVITRIIKNIDYKTPYREDPYGIELIRANIGNKTNVNSSSDNDTCKLQVSSLVPAMVLDLQYWGGLSGYAFTTWALTLQRANQILSGLPDELLTPNVGSYSMYNVNFSPQRKAQRMLPWLTSNYRGLVNSVLNISGYKKNISLVSQIFPGGSVIAESDYINVSNAPQTYTPPFRVTPVTVQSAETLTGRANAAIFLPYEFNFKGPAIKGLPKKMTPPGTVGGGKMYKKIKFVFARGRKRYPLAGFVLDIGISPGSNEAYNYRLLASPSCVIPIDL